MAERRPLVLINGEVQQLPAGDTLPGLGGGSAVSIGPVYRTKAAGSITLGPTDPVYQILSGPTTGQVILMPDAEDCTEGKRFVFMNESGASIYTGAIVGASPFVYAHDAGYLFEFERGFGPDGVTPAWVSPGAVAYKYENMYIGQLSVYTNGIDAAAPLVVGPDSDPVDPDVLPDGSVWVTATGFKVKVGGVVHDLLAGGGAAPDIGPLYVDGTGVDYTIPNSCPEIVYFTSSSVDDRIILPLPQDVPEGKRIVVRNIGGFDIALRVPTTTSYFETGLSGGALAVLVRGFALDGTTPQWVGENETPTRLRYLTAFGLATGHINGMAPLYIGYADSLVEASLDDGAVWMDAVSIKARVNGETKDLLSSASTVYECEVDFGPTPVSSGQFTITNPAVLATSKIVAMQSGNAPTGKDAEENAWDVLVPRAKANAGSFTLWVECLTGKVSGRFKFNYLVGG